MCNFSSEAYNIEISMNERTVVVPLCAISEYKRTTFKVLEIRGLLWCDHPHFFIGGTRHLKEWQSQDCCGATIRSFLLEVHNIESCTNKRAAVVRTSAVFHLSRTTFKVVAIRGLLWCEHPQFFITGAEDLK